MRDKITVFCSVSADEIENVRTWLIPSLNRQKNINEINLYFINYTGNGIIWDGDTRIGKVVIKEISDEKQMGFGESHNFAFEKIKPTDQFIIINPDVSLHEGCFDALGECYDKSENVGVVEACQVPFEHPKGYDKKTNETVWASGFLLFVNSDFFKKVGGFDPSFWMYCEDVDLSWRSWLTGYKVLYCPDAGAYHFTGGHFDYRDDRFYLEQYWSARNFLVLAYKYFGQAGLNKARRYLNASHYPKEFKQSILNAFDAIDTQSYEKFYKENKDKISEFDKKIKITGFNQYH